MSLVSAARTLWRRGAPAPLRRAFAPALLAGIHKSVALGLPPTADPPAAGPIRICGPFTGSHGIARSAELCARALESLGASVERIAIQEGFDPVARLPAPAPAAAWIFHLNAPELPLALFNLGANHIRGPRYGVWAWELPAAPRSWLRDASLLTEVWAPSRYTAGAFTGARSPVRVVPHPIIAADYADVRPAPRRHAFHAISLFDVKSSAARKNPQGALAAFVRAFGDAPDVRLTIKAQNGDAYPGLIEALRRGAPANVEVIDEVWPQARVNALIAGADAVLSLHRAEGFGLVLAEAMALGTPVIATAWSGNLDFMDETCALMVPAGRIAAEDPQGAYRGQAWADPDLDAAAAALIRLRNDPEIGRRLSAAARDKVASLLSPQAWARTLPAGLQALLAK